VSLLGPLRKSGKKSIYKNKKKLFKYGTNFKYYINYEYLLFELFNIIYIYTLVGGFVDQVADFTKQLQLLPLFIFTRVKHVVTIILILELLW
jgi:hypothetical protein